MFSIIKEYADKSVTLKEAKENVKEMSLIKEVGLYIILSIILFVVMTIVQIIFLIVSHSFFGISSIINQDQILPSLFAFITIPVLVYLYISKIEKRSWRSVGFSKGNAISSTLKGLLIGFGMFLAVVVIGVIFGQYQFNGIDLSAIIYTIPFFIGYAIQSFGEEISARGWTITYFSKRHSIITAILINCIIFIIPHLANKGIDLLSCINLLLVGILFSILFLKYDNIWVCGGLHTAWNFSQGILFGFKVSGNVNPVSLLKFSQINSSIINGGNFGPESSLIVTFVYIISIIIALYYTKNKAKNS